MIDPLLEGRCRCMPPSSRCYNELVSSGSFIYFIPTNCAMAGEVLLLRWGSRRIPNCWGFVLRQL